MECISEPLLKGCLEGYIEPTRTRACHKDDTGYMEQKNFDAVRKTVGSFRFDTPAEYAALGEVYQFLYHYGHPSFKVLLKDNRPMDDTRKSTKRNPNRLVEGVSTALLKVFKPQRRRRRRRKSS